MDDNTKKQQVSPKKLAANQKNALRSTGPKTAAGKMRSAENSYKHGIFAFRLFSNKEQLTREWADYDSLYKGIFQHFSPVGYIENLWVEKIASQALRHARLLGFEQKVLSWVSPFEARSVDRIVRYESLVTRQFNHAIEELERLQEKRLAESNEPESSQLEPDDATGEPHEPTEKSSEPQQDAEGEELAEDRPPEGKPEASPTLEPVDGAVDVAHDSESREEESPDPTRSATDESLQPENCGTKLPDSARSVDPSDEDLLNCV